MKTICKIILKLLGWKAIEPPAPEPKCIILGAPHTSGWDFIISYLYYTSVGGKAFVLVKKSFFWGPLRPIMRAMGGIPVDRSKGASLVRQVIEEFNKADKMHLAIAPEGTRKRTVKWKSGFHTIATAVNVPVYTGYFDWKTKTVGRGERIELTDNPDADLKRVREWYKNKGVEGRHPELFTTGNDLN